MSCAVNHAAAPCHTVWDLTSWQKRVVFPSSADSANSVHGSFSRVQKAKGMSANGKSGRENLIYNSWTYYSTVEVVIREKCSLQASWKQTTFTPHMAATATISPTRLCMALICGGDRRNSSYPLSHISAHLYLYLPQQASLCACSVPDLVQDRGVSRQNDAVLDESHPDPPGRPQLFLDGFETVTLQLKVTLQGSFHSTCWEVQRPVADERENLLLVVSVSVSVAAL